MRDHPILVAEIAIRVQVASQLSQAKYADKKIEAPVVGDDVTSFVYIAFFFPLFIRRPRRVSIYHLSMNDFRFFALVSIRTIAVYDDWETGAMTS